MSQITFQVIDWYGKDRQPDDEDNEEEDRFVYAESYDVNIFGRTEDGQSVALQVTGFHPFFYIKVPDNFHASSVSIFRDYIEREKRILSKLLLDLSLIHI